VKLYEVQARKWENAWELQIEGAGQLWSPSLADAEARAREHIVSTTGVAEAEVHVTLVPEVDDETDRLALEARRAVGDADDAHHVASVKTREVVRRLAAAGLSQEDIARFLEIPWARLAELIYDPSEQRRAELPKRRR
jgi:hypothetical protein